MATGVTLPNDRFEAPLVVGNHVHLVLRAFHTAVGATWSIDDVKTGRSKEPAYAGDINEAKAVAEAVAKAHAHHVLRRADSNDQVPPIVWHSI
jgi:hypothetical protein